MKKFIIIAFMCFSVAFGQVDKALSFLNGLNFFPKAEFKNYNYYRNFYGEVLLELDDSVANLKVLGVALAFPANEVFTVEFELFTGLPNDLSAENNEIQIEQGYGASLIYYYPLGNSFVITGRYGWNSIELQEKKDDKINELEIEGDSYGFGIAIHILPKIYFSYEYRNFPNTKDGFSDDSSIYAIEIKF